MFVDHFRRYASLSRALSLLSLVSAHAVRRNTQEEMIESVEKLKYKSTDEIYETVIFPDWQEMEMDWRRGLEPTPSSVRRPLNPQQREALQKACEGGVYEKELMEAVEKLKDRSTDEVYKAVIIPDWQEVGNGLEKIGANPGFSEMTHQILNNDKLSRKQVEEEFMKLIDEQPVETKELLKDVTHQAEGTVAEIKLRLIKELSQLATRLRSFSSTRTSP